MNVVPSFGSLVVGVIWVVGRWLLGVGRWGLGRWGQTLFSVYSQWFVGVRPCFRSLLANLANLANEIMLEYKQNFLPCSHPLENQNPS